MAVTDVGNVLWLRLAKPDGFCYNSGIDFSGKKEY